MGRQNEKKENDRSVRRTEEMGLPLLLKRREWRQMPDTTERGREFQITGPMYWKGLSPRVLLPILGTQTIRVRLSEEREKERRNEAAQRGMEELYQRKHGSRWQLFWSGRKVKGEWFRSHANDRKFHTRVFLFFFLSRKVSPQQWC